MKLLKERRAALGRDHFMISNSQVVRCVTPGIDLVLDEVIPRFFFIIGEICGLTLFVFLRDKILVRTVNRAQVTQVPVEGNVVLLCVCCNRGHNNVATIARVA